MILFSFILFLFIFLTQHRETAFVLSASIGSVPENIKMCGLGHFFTCWGCGHARGV